MSRERTTHRCRECGTTAVRWAGRCPHCGAWNSLAEERVGAGPRGLLAEPVALAEVSSEGGEPWPTGIAEFDRALSGGLVPGSVTLVGGEPGVGKSTLLLQLAAAVASSGAKVLICSAEESPEQIRRRADRLDAAVDGVSLLATTSLAEAVAAAERLSPELLVIDSVQTIGDPDLGAPGSVAQVREVAARLVSLAKRRHIATVLVGHVTKEGELAGPRVLEHLVDTVCSFEGDRHHALRMLAINKHRFGPTGELGVFAMGEHGLVSVEDPSAFMLADRRPGAAGCVVAPVLEGRRPLLVEIQALVAESALGTPRRTAQGIIPGRLALLVAVLERRASCPLARYDVFASAVGGVRVSEPASDLALALALASSALGRPVPADVVACGEVGLGGEVRQVTQTPKRLSEAARRGFRRAIVPWSAPADCEGIELVRVRDLAEAVETLR
ncbi:MAG: DNA repair protein RadA [Actinomycetota bacterium]|nr:DNA repair protein RadA [Actinomycetota bacterium]